MIEFNIAILVSWILDGYEGLRVYNYKSCHVIEPIIENDFDDGCLADYDLMSITDPRAIDLANGFNPDNLRSYVEQLYLVDRKSVDVLKAVNRAPE